MIRVTQRQRFYAAPQALLAGALYLAINLGYSLGLKRFVGVRQLCVAVGFWLRLKSGASPVTDIPLTVWASMFTLGLAYRLAVQADQALQAVQTDQALKMYLYIGPARTGEAARGR